MSTVRVFKLADLFDEAFQDRPGHSLLTNLESVTPEEWLWVALRGRGSARNIVAHIGACKNMDHNQGLRYRRTHLGGSAWDRESGALTTFPSAIARLGKGHQRLRRGITAPDDELLQLRRHHAGKSLEPPWIIRMVIAHDLAHAGAINSMRAWSIASRSAWVSDSACLTSRWQSGRWVPKSTISAIAVDGLALTVTSG
jgi:hypothetical protein